MAWYDTGTVSVTNGSTTVTGSGTNFLTGAQIGEAFLAPDDKLYEIASISSSTVLVLADGYLGSTQSGQAYKIVPTQSLVADLASDVTDLISDYATVKDTTGAGKFLDGAVATPSITFDQDQDTGFYRVGANELGVAVGGLNVASFGSTGLTTLGNDLLDSSDIGATVQAYDADVAKTDVAQAFTAKQTMSAGFDLDAIATSISDTAVDVFVYDTSKDSDGGAWRKRTQGTSWYNETLNTSTRGSRKEFPAVAVIVLESNQTTIYDGDDPDMPMWMTFINAGGGSGVMLGENSNKCVTMLNGIIAVGSAPHDFYVVNFIKDNGGQYSNNVAISGYYKGNISQRNVTTMGFNVGTLPNIIHRTINDCAMTVLPNAPIDPATNLPIPTIAVATDGGVSVIKDDGSVVDITGQAQANSHISFSSNNEIITNRSYRTELAIYAIPSTDINYAAFLRVYYPDNNSTNPADPKVLQGSAPTLALDSAYSGGNGLTLIEENPAAPSKGSVAYITSDYSTGHMVGDIKLAALSDTDDTDVVGGEVFTDNDFTGDGTAWTLSGGGVSYDATNNEIDVSSGTGWRTALNSSTIVPNKYYIVSFTTGAVTYADDVIIRVGNANSLWVGSAAANTTYTATVKAGGLTNLDLQFGASFVGSITNVTCYLADSDRSVNGNGLAVHGTITKEPVATGADLVGYSGFSGSNYLEQPYNSDLDFGTGDFSFMGWVKSTSTAAGEKYMFRRSDGTSFSFYINSNMGSYISVGLGGANYITGTALTVNTWTFIVFNKISNVGTLYQQGSLDATGSASATVNNATSPYITVGVKDLTGVASFIGSIANLRISATAPSAEQIAKIYEDEKPLFQENAQATLYGTSDAVTALAHDSDTNLLHVGTSSGRSVFQGLKRVDNTTTAVGAAISASNGLVVED